MGMSTRRTSPESISLYQIVAGMQEEMEARGLSSEIVDAIVERGLEVLLGVRRATALSRPFSSR